MLAILKTLCKPTILNNTNYFKRWLLTYRIRPRQKNRLRGLGKCNGVMQGHNHPNLQLRSIRVLHSSNSYKNNRSTVHYVIAIGILTFGLSFAAVPLYRIFCQAYSYGGTTQQDDLRENKVEKLRKRADREIKIRFNADTAASMQWNFKPQQREIKVIPGETALAFYSARNPTLKPVIGVSTYNVIPFDAGQYFNKIQCFCFEEQMLNPEEEVSMPVFFYIDPEFADDPKMEFVNEIILSYTFFEVRDDLKLPIPAFIKH